MNKIKSSAHFQGRPILYQIPRIAIIISLFLDRILYKVIILTNSIIRHVANDTSIKTSYVFLLDTIKEIIKNNRPTWGKYIHNGFDFITNSFQWIRKIITKTTTNNPWQITSSKDRENKIDNEILKNMDSVVILFNITKQLQYLLAKTLFGHNLISVSYTHLTLPTKA